ncbi:hypothetical protein [Albibacterium profundi]|uniref:Uncharacterized protein n=1 Tax=Albibacterium profundi TaxID=3134906 RepID=A0ABV5CEB1_9SPHI
MKYALIIALLFSSQLGYSQTPEEQNAKDLRELEEWKKKQELILSRQPGDPIARDLRALAASKRTYERFTLRAKSRPSEFSAKKKEAYEAYVNQAKKIKDNPKIYLNYIERQLKNPELIEGPPLPYNYFEAIGLMVNTKYYLITRRDLYLVIKYSLFERGMDLLPEKLDGIPLIDRPKNISPHAELQTIEEAERGLPAGSLKN